MLERAQHRGDGRQVDDRVEASRERRARGRRRRRCRPVRASTRGSGCGCRSTTRTAAPPAATASDDDVAADETRAAGDQHATPAQPPGGGGAHVCASALAVWGSSLVVSRHFTVGMIAARSTRSRWRSTTSNRWSISVVDSSVGFSPRLLERGVLDVVVVVLELDARVVDVLDRALRPGYSLATVSAISPDRHRLGQLVEDAELAPVGRVLGGEPDALDSVDDVDQAARLRAVAVHRQRVTEHRLDHHPVEDRAEHAVVVEARGQARVELGLLGVGSVHHALVQVGRAQAPDPTAELDVVAVVDLGEVVEGARALGVQDPVLAAVVLDLDPALLDVDVRRAVLAHRAELDQVDVAVDVGDRVHHVELADDVVGLRVDGVLLARSSSTERRAARRSGRSCRGGSRRPSRARSRGRRDRRRTA